MPVKEFIERYGDGPVGLARAPGRVNLIGEHTDYNGGYVMPMAIDRDMRIAFRPADDDVIEIVSLDMNETVSVPINAIDPGRIPDWAKYPLGVAIVLQKEGHELKGLRAVAKGDVPIGAGLSSSAAFEVAAGMALMTASGHRINRQKLAVVCQRAENEVVGMRCGIMDQFASLMCRKGRALFLDCTTLDYDLVPLKEDEASIVVCNTCVKHELVGSPYNERRRQCAAAFKLLQRRFREIETYKDVTVEMFLTHAGNLEETIRKRGHHVVTEDSRVLAAADALRAGNLVHFGIMMDASHESLRDDFEVSCEELDAMVECARAAPGTYGARMTGGGFGGCTVNLVPNGRVDVFCKQVRACYEGKTGVKPEIHVCRASDGATVEENVKP